MTWLKTTLKESPAAPGQKSDCGWGSHPEPGWDPTWDTHTTAEQIGHCSKAALTVSFKQKQSWNVSFLMALHANSMIPVKVGKGQSSNLEDTCQYLQMNSVLVPTCNGIWMLFGCCLLIFRTGQALPSWRATSLEIAEMLLKFMACA